MSAIGAEMAAACQRESKSMYILGISAFYHDSAACLVQDGEIVAAAQEERFIRSLTHTRCPLGRDAGH